MINKIVRFNGWDCEAQTAIYDNGQKALLLRDRLTGEAVCKASACVDVDLPEGHTAIKDYSENEGILKSLLDAGVVALTGNQVASGFVSMEIVEILI